MSIPYNEILSIKNYRSDATYACLNDLPPTEQNLEDPATRAKGMLYSLTFKGPARSVQFVRDALRLILKVPVRSFILKPIFFEKNWQERERATVNLKLVGYSFIQLVAMPVKFVVALVALGIAKRNPEKAQEMLNECDIWTRHHDGRASQLEALKEEGAKSANDRAEFEAYRNWLYGIRPEFCRKLS